MLVSLCVETEHTDTLSSTHLAGSGPETTKLMAYFYSQSLKILQKSLFFQLSGPEKLPSASTGAGRVWAL